MGLLDRIQDHNSAAAQAELNALLERDARRQEIKAARERIVYKAVAKFAAQEGCAITELNRVDGQRYFLVGDMVLMVREERMLDVAKAESMTAKEVLWQHIVYLIGLDRTDRIERIRIGVLQMLRFEGVLQAHNVGMGRYDFDYIRVVQALYR